MIGLVGAVQFLTRVPVRTATAPDLARSVPWFPVVGGLLGLALGAIVLGAGELVPFPVAAAVAVLIGVVVTGAFHEDGLADVADAFAGGWSRARRLEILKDPLHGSYGVAALCGSIVLRVVCVAAMPSGSAALAGLVAAHSAARGAAVGVIGLVPSATTGGLGADHTRSSGSARIGSGVVAAVAITALATGWWVAPITLAATVAAAAVAWLARRKIGGTTGDVLGAVEQVAECLVLIVVTGLAARHTVWWRTAGG